MVAWFMAAGVKPGKKLKGALVVCAAEDIEEVGDLLLAGVGNVEALVARNAGAAQTAAGASRLSSTSGHEEGHEKGNRRAKVSVTL